MKTMVKILCVALTAALLLAGCAAPKLTLGGTSNVAGSVNGTDIATGEYLAYLYNNFYNMYYGQGLYQYAAYGYDVWTQKFPYGEGDDAKQLEFADYIKESTKDTIARQFALRQMMKDNGVEWNKDDLADLEKNMESVGENAYMSLGISNENFVKVYKEVTLNENGLFYGLYGEGGKREVSEADRRAYFDKNYLSYKIISETLTDENGSELDEAGQKKVTDELNKYLEQYNADKNFEKVMDAYNKANAEEGAEIEATKDEDNRVNADATQMSDAKLVEAIRGVDVGSAKVVTYKANDTTATAALIVRLDPNDPATLFTDETKAIIYGAKYEEFDKEVDEAVAKLDVQFNKSVVKKCDPKNFVD